MKERCRNYRVCEMTISAGTPGQSHARTPPLCIIAAKVEANVYSWLQHGKAGTAWGPHPGGYDFKPKKAEKKKVEEKKPEDKKSSYDLPEFTSRKPDLSKSIATQT